MNTDIATILSLSLWMMMLPTVVYSVDEASPQMQTLDTASVAVLLVGKTWRQSYEEQKEDSKVLIFKTEGSKVFPPSRFRMAYKFMKDGKCEWYYLSPDDAHRFKQGLWSIGAKDKSLITITTEDGARVYGVITITKDNLEFMEVKR